MLSTTNLYKKINVPESSNHIMLEIRAYTNQFFSPQFLDRLIKVSDSLKIRCFFSPHHLSVVIDPRESNTKSFQVTTQFLLLHDLLKETIQNIKQSLNHFIPDCLINTIIDYIGCKYFEIIVGDCRKILCHHFKPVVQRNLWHAIEPPFSSNFKIVSTLDLPNIFILKTCIFNFNVAPHEINGLYKFFKFPRSIY